MDRWLRILLGPVIGAVGGAFVAQIVMQLGFLPEKYLFVQRCLQVGFAAIGAVAFTWWAIDKARDSACTARAGAHQQAGVNQHESRV